jgi:hypothetical protein
VVEFGNVKQYDLSINSVAILSYKFSIILVVSLHWVGCFCYMVAGWNDFDETTWPIYVSVNGEPRHSE